MYGWLAWLSLLCSREGWVGLRRGLLSRRVKGGVYVVGVRGLHEETLGGGSQTRDARSLRGPARALDTKQLSAGGQCDRKDSSSKQAFPRTERLLFAGSPHHNLRTTHRWRPSTPSWPVGQPHAAPLERSSGQEQCIDRTHIRALRCHCSLVWNIQSRTRAFHLRHVPRCASLRRSPAYGALALCSGDEPHKRVDIFRLHTHSSHTPTVQ